MPRPKLMRPKGSLLSRKNASPCFRADREVSVYSLRDKYAISGIGWTEYSKKSGRTVRSLASEACLKAIDDAGLKVSDVDGFVSFNFNDSVPAISVAHEI